MKFNLPIVATVLLGLAVANPTPQYEVSRDTDMAVRSESTALIVYVNGEALSPDVSIKCVLNCATVLAEAVCIAAAIVAKSPAALVKCLSIGKICGCVDCVPGLKDFVHDHGLCN
ncbi:hypothetical protein B0J14DRAFT_693214 [Halenospora varia]|nr:hypothetical protein B0J14DRAFT_693214 [Halenospora varia]